jgi:hypothetical protein
VLLFDGFAVLDHERPDVDSKLGGNGSDWFDVSGDRVGNVTRLTFRLSRASPTTVGTIRLVFAIGSTPFFDNGALGSFHSSRRVTQLLQWAAPSRWCASRTPSGASCASPSRVRLAVSRRLRAALCARSSNSACCRWRAASTRPLSRSWLHTFLSFTTPRSSTVSSTASANRCAASTRWRRSTRVLSGSQRNAIVSCTRAQVCYVLDSWQLRHYASDFLARQRAVCRLLRFSGAGARSTRARRGQLQ